MNQMMQFSLTIGLIGSKNVFKKKPIFFPGIVSKLRLLKSVSLTIVFSNDFFTSVIDV